MNNASNLLLAVITIIFLSTIGAVNGIKCFQCDTYDDGCSSLTEADVDSKYFQDCGEKHTSPFCRKTIQTILESNHLVRITRTCGWKTMTANTTRCFSNDTQFKLDVTCQCYTDGCNSADSLTGRSTFFRYFIPITSLLTIRRLS